MKRLMQAITLLVLTSSPVLAEDYWALNLGSYHFDRTNPLNETNLGAGYGRKWGHCGAEGGAYWNSHDRLAVYGLGFCETSKQVKQALSAGAFLGLASAYQAIPDNYHGIIPIAGLQLSAGPFVARVNAEVAFFSIRFPID